jgi:hypothetical protein
MKPILLTLAAAALLGACAAPADSCTDLARIADLPPALDEASGIAVSRRDPRLLWVHNDSEGTPLLYAIDRSAQLVAEIALPDARAQFDWEDIAAGPCPAGNCLYIGDIGDNRHDRDDRAILRIAEPVIGADTAPAVERFPFRLPDGAEDAEALFVSDDAVVYIVTKGRRQPVTVFRYPPPLRAGEIVTLERVQHLTDGIAQLPDLVTGADASGDVIAIRTYSRVQLYRFAGDTLAPLLEGTGFDIAALAEPQGEGIALAGDTVLLVTETGPQRAQPFLSQLRCVVD